MRLQNKWSIKLPPTLLQALNNSWILSSRMLHSWQLRVCAMIIAARMGGERWGDGKQKNNNKKNQPKTRKNKPREAPAGRHTLGIAALIKLPPPFSLGAPAADTT